MRIYFVCIWLASLPAAQAHVLVGNGGEGITQDGQLFLRDLYEYGAYVRPFVGQREDAQIKKDVANWKSLALSSAQKELLAKKLTDAENLYPHLGTYLLRAAQFYQWTFQDQPLSLLPETFAQVHYPDERRAQIASRYQSTILVERDHYQRLDDTNRIALILHEATYALARNVRVGGTEEPTPDLGAVKVIVSGLFTPALENKPALREIIRKTLQIPDETQEITDHRQLTLSPMPAFGESPPFAAMSIADGTDQAARLRLLDSFCARLRKSGEWPGIHVDANQPSTMLVASRVSGQISLGIKAANPHLDSNEVLGECEFLGAMLDSFYDYGV